MRKITFIIDDLAWIKQHCHLPDKEFAEIFQDQTSFRVTYTLIGNRQPERYELIDSEGQKLNINNLNGYEKGLVLNDCSAYFTGGKFSNGGSEPFGVISIKETEI